MTNDCDIYEKFPDKTKKKGWVKEHLRPGMCDAIRGVKEPIRHDPNIFIIDDMQMDAQKQGVR